jgi:hypothetical protein
MKLKDIADMEEYLENRCYCPYEIYDMTGFFFNCFEPDVECELLAKGERGAIHGTFVMAKPSQFNKNSLQIIYIEHKDGYVESCIRLDATENNKEQILKFLNGEIEKMVFDEYADTKTEESLKEILSITDAIVHK